MKKIYLDQTQLDSCVGVFMRGAEVIPAGATICAMSPKHRNSEYQRYSDEYDIRFLFTDALPTVDFYTVPQVDIFATDSRGGFLCALGGGFDRESQVCYIDRERNCFLSSCNGGELLKNPENWRAALSPCDEVAFFASVEEAKEKYDFLDLKELPKE